MAEDRLILWCGNAAQHPAHTWESGAAVAGLEPDPLWCDGCNADGTTPYDPMRPGYERPERKQLCASGRKDEPVPMDERPERPTPEAVHASPLWALGEIAADVKGHLSLHASWGSEAIRHPAPDWTVQLIYTAAVTGPQPEPVAWFGTGATLDEACEGILDQLLAALASKPTQKDTP